MSSQLADLLVGSVAIVALERTGVLVNELDVASEAILEGERCGAGRASEGSLIFMD